MDCQFEEYEHGRLNSYCFAQGTFVREAENGEQVKFGGNHTGKTRVRYCSYYSWVGLALLLQAVFCCMPYWMWKSWERGRIQALTSEIRCPILDNEIVQKKAESLSEYFLENLHTHNVYAYQYFTYELLTVINAVGQILFMHRFIGDGFQFYGIYVLFMNRDDMEKRIGQLFPMTTICTFEKYNPTGREAEFEGICRLMHNLLNEKIYSFLWFWMHLAAIVSIVVIIYRIHTLFMSSFRLYLLRFTSKNADEIHAVYKKLQIGDWFLLMLLQKNVNSEVYKALITRLAESASIHDVPSI